MELIFTKHTFVAQIVLAEQASVLDTHLVSFQATYFFSFKTINKILFNISQV